MVEIGGIHTNDQGSVHDYFKFYSKLQNQANMLQDLVRTQIYNEAIMRNRKDFEGKVVMDLGCGSGILSLFAAQAGAKKVYAVEASNMAAQARILIKANNFEHIIEVVNKKIEDITEEDVGEKVDTIISEPLGTFLLNERMLESYVIARNKFLKPEGLMMPTSAHFHIMPFQDDVLFKEQEQKVAFFDSKNFYNLDFSCLKEQALKEKFAQPVVEAYPLEQALATANDSIVFDFQTCTLKDLQEIDFHFNHQFKRASIVHGYALHFDAHFKGSENLVILRTGPEAKTTHWYQTRLLLREPIAANKGQVVKGLLKMRANRQQTFDTQLQVAIPEIGIKTEATYDMKDPEYRSAYCNYTDNFQDPIVPNWSGK